MFFTLCFRDLKTWHFDYTSSIVKYILRINRAKKNPKLHTIIFFIKTNIGIILQLFFTFHWIRYMIILAVLGNETFSGKDSN